MQPLHHWSLLAMLTAITGPSLSAHAEDLWARRVPDRAFLFIDSQARSVGDLLTLIISEDTDVDQKDNRALSKEAASNGAFDLGADAGGGFGVHGADAGLDFGGSTDRKFGGNSSFRSARQFSDRLTLTVVDVLPNGNLIVTGRRRLNVDRDQRELVVSGVVRPIDVSADNTVRSQFVSELRVSYVGQGPEMKYTRRGWFGRPADIVWPF